MLQVWQFTQEWSPRWPSTISANLRNVLQWRSKHFLLPFRVGKILLFPDMHNYTFKLKIFFCVRSMNTFLIIYLGILLFEAILSTILKYAWQAEDKWDEPFYNQKTEQERNSSPVSLLCTKCQRNTFLLVCFSVSSAV